MKRSKLPSTNHERIFWIAAFLIAVVLVFVLARQISGPWPPWME